MPASQNLSRQAQRLCAWLGPAPRVCWPRAGPDDVMCPTDPRFPGGDGSEGPVNLCKDKLTPEDLGTTRIQAPNSKDGHQRKDHH